MVTDETLLQFTGGVTNNCLNNILNAGNTVDKNNELPIIRRSHIMTLINLINWPKTIKYFKFKFTVHKYKV